MVAIQSRRLVEIGSQKGAVLKYLFVGFTLLVGLAHLAAANCECGYSASIEDSVHVFTDLIETDFAHLSDIAKNTDWIRQEFNVTAKQNRGVYGEMFDIENMRTFINTKNDNENGLAQNGRPAGLELTVKSSLVKDMVPVSEIDSNRTDVLFGTFRAAIKLTKVSGTCSAFFWYYNDTQEIDMEFLSREYNATNSSYPVNLVLQSREAAEEGYNAQKTPTFIKAYLPFDPTEDFHEYRIDFLPGIVVFYADSQPLARMDSDAVPTHAGHLVLQQWSNGNPLWSGGPPEQDSITTVAYVKAYFNSSLPEREKDWSIRCHDTSAPGAVCAIPATTATNSTAMDWFFTYQKNMTENQTVSGQESAGARTVAAGMLWPLAGMGFAAAGRELGLW